MADWKPFPRAGHPAFDAERLKAHWPHLHRGDAEPWPDDPLVVQAWVLFHNGEFQRAAEAGLAKSANAKDAVAASAAEILR